MLSDFARESRVLVTGATGWLGGALAADLLNTPDWDRVLLLVRAESAGHGYQRAIRSVARFVSGLDPLRRIRPDQVIVGDYTHPARFADDARLRSVRRVVHCAELRAPGTHPRLISTNVDGTLRFVHHLGRVTTIERFLYVSSAMICGRHPGRLVREADGPSSRVRHVSPYAAGKAEAERLLRLTLRAASLVVARPSLLVGHTRLGCAPSGRNYWPFRMTEALGMTNCRPDGRMDIIPVDYAAAALRYLAFKPRLRHATYHIAAGEESCCTWREIAMAFAGCQIDRESAAVARHFSGHTTATEPLYRTVPFAEIAARKNEFDARFGRCNKKSLLAAAARHARHAELDVVFDTRRLQFEGFGPGPRFTDYLPACERSCMARSIAAQAAAELD